MFIIYWSDEETNKLVENYSTHTNEELLNMFPNRSFLSIYKKAWKLNLVKNKNVAFIDRSKKGEKSPFWKGGKKLTKYGYILALSHGHHRADKGGYVLEHILVFEKATGIEVPKDCCVHHINGNKQDNRIENLCLMTKKAHTLLHHCGTNRSLETKKKISEAAKKWLSDKTKHPQYKNIDIEGILKLRSSGATIKSICEKCNICKSTYYKKVKEKSYE